MSARTPPAFAPPRPNPIGAIALYLVFIAETARALVSTTDRALWPWYLGLHSAFIVLFTVVLWRQRLPVGLLHGYFVLQSAILLALLALNPELDFETALFVLLCYQAALVFAGPTRWFWTGVFVLLTGGSLMFFLGPLRGLALGLTTMVVGFIIPAYVIANRETEAARIASQMVLGELEETHRQLQAYAGQVEELAAMEERNRLARELHDSVSQTMFSLLLATRSTQILLERDPSRVRSQLEQLQGLTQDALAQMRSLIAELRPKTG